MAAVSSSSSSSFPILCFLSLLLPHISSSITTTTTTTTISLPLTFSTTKTFQQDPYQKLSHLAALSIARAHRIKFPHKPNISTNTATSAASANAPLFPHSYGGYSISLKFGTPPQSIPFILDTGSSFVWFPCTRHYACKNCSPSGTQSNNIPTFIPKSSSSAQILGCLNPKCTWIHNTTDPSSRCRDCPNPANCKQICPPYLIIYGSGSTGGITLIETLNLPKNKKVPNFIVGCSVFSTHQPAGIAGFGRGLSSMPSQLGLKKFSYCLISHKFDDTDKSSALLLDGTSNSEKKTPNLSYTKLLKNPESMSVYYYISLRKITVGDQKVEIPYKYLVPDDNGNGGTIVDSGTTFTYINRNVFDPILNAFVQQVKGYERAESVENQIGLRPCFNISGHETLSLPELKLYFKGGAEMELPLSNYFFVVGDDVVCLTMVTSGLYGPERSIGPSVILGNFQMQNYEVEFDLGNERFGFRQQSCT